MAMILLGAIGVAVGLTLPRSATASALVLAVAVPSLAILVLGAESLAPMHGLHRVVRLPLRSAVSATLESYWSRVAGSARGIWGRTSGVASTPREDLDDDAVAWWGSSRAEGNIEGVGTR
jgi:hypothetical protein